jgi:hypothetical protein
MKQVVDSISECNDLIETLDAMGIFHKTINLFTRLPISNIPLHSSDVLAAITDEVINL